MLSFHHASLSVPVIRWLALAQGLAGGTEPRWKLCIGQLPGHVSTAMQQQSLLVPSDQSSAPVYIAMQKRVRDKRHILILRFFQQGILP